MKLEYDLKTLCDILDLEAQKTVGKVLKRFEIIDNKEILKKSIKELLYESFRDLRDILIALGRGLEPTVFKFKAKEKSEK